MKKHTNKIISWVMILAMMIGMVPANMITAFAAGGNGFVTVEVSGNTAVATAESSHSDGTNISIIAHKKGLEFTSMGYPAITVDTIEDDNSVPLTADNIAFNVDALYIGSTVSVTFPSGNAGDWVVVAYSDDSNTDLDITEVQIDTTGNVLAALEYIYTTDLPAMTVGEAITEIDVATATGGTAPLTYSATGLPAGLAISADGKITGMPTAKAAESAGTGITITVTDSATTPVTADATIGSAAIAEGVQTLSRKAGETVTSIFVGQTVQVTGQSNVPAGENATLAYSGSTVVASVSAGGLVTGLIAGTVNVLIDSAATTNYGAATQLSVAIEVKAAGTNDLAITAVADPLQYGNEITMATTGGNGETVTWSSSNTTDAPIGTDGKVTAANYTGTITITATQPAKADGSVAGSTVTTTVTLAPRVATVGAGDFAITPKDYDKGTTATVTGALAVTNIVNSDDVTITGTTAAYADSNAGNNITMTLSGSTLAGAKAAYYTLAGATMPAIKGDIKKATIATAPTLDATTSKTATEIVLTAPIGTPEGAGAVEYSKDGGTTWQDSATFTGLAAATEYTFVARWTADASGNYLPSDASAEYKVTTENTPTYTIVAKTVPTFADITFGAAQPAAQDVVFTNSGNQAQTITATLEGADKDKFVLTGTAANIAAGADATFSIQPKADLAAKTYTVQVKAISANNATGVTTTDITIVVSKATLAAPVAPTEHATTKPTATTITLATIAAPTGGTIEYACVTDATNVTGKTSGIFTGLSADTEYTFTAKAIADASGNYADSVASAASAKIKTLDAPTYTIVEKTVPTFADITFGAAQPAAQNVVFTNSGNQAQTITATLEGADKGSFTLTGTAANIAAGADATFSIQPNAGLAAGTYTVQVKAKSDNNATGATTTDITIVVNKATLAAPVAPTEHATTKPTATTITLATIAAPTGGTIEYACVTDATNVTGKTSGIFTGLSADTEYTFTAKAIADASGNYADSVASAASAKIKTLDAPTYTIVEKTVPTFADITFGAAQPAAQDVVFTNSGNQAQTITATLEGADKGSFTLTGTAANIAAGADATFSIQPKADLAAGTYTVQVKAISANNATGATTTDITIIVNKAMLAAPVAPTEHATTKPTATTITLATIAAPTGGTIEYACVTDATNVTGKTSGIFTGLSADTEYTFTAKAIADASGNYADSAASAASAKIKTLNAPTYTFTLDKNADNFATDSVFGYTAQAAETITIRNTGNQVLTGVAIAPAGDSASFDISALSSTTIAAGATATFTVTPKAGLNAKTGAYTATYVVSATSATTAGTDATFTATFEVAKAKITGTLNATKAYDGNANMTLAQIAAKELNGVNGEKFTLSTLTGAMYSEADVHATTAAANKGTIAVTPVGGALAANYDVTDVTGITINGAITAAPIAGKPTVTGKPIFGETLTASVAGVTPAGATLAYQWKAGGAEIAGATSATLVLAADQVGKTITVEVTASGNYSGSAESAATAVVTKKSITGAVSITDKNAGTLVVGDALAADLSGVIPADAQSSTYTYSWKNGSTEVGTAAEYTVKAGDTSITLTITVDSADARFDGFLTSAAVEPGKTALVSVGIPTSDNGTVWGSILTAGAIDPIGAQTEVDYQWMSNGTNVGTNSSSYTTVIGDVGKTITVKITPKATSTAYSGSATSPAFGPMTNQAQTAPSATTTVGGPYYDKVVVNTVVGQEYLINTANDVTTNSPAWVAATGTTHEFTGLTAGTPYYVFTRLAAKTGYDASPASSSATQATKTLAVPGAPENLVVTAGNKTLTVSWKAPTDDGGSAITKYTVQLDATPAIEVTSGTTHTFTDLTNDTLYNITVAAVNAQGTGANATGSGTPKAQSGGGTSDTSPAPTPTEFVVSFEAGTNGKITSGETKVSVKADAMVEKTPTVVAADGFTFKGWSIDGKTVVDPKTVKITKATTFTALYEIDDIFFNKSLKGSYIEGYEDSTFGPQKPITRAEVAEIIARTLSKQMEEGKTYSTNFTDVDSSKWYANAIGFLAEVGVVDGYEDATFRPNSNISRAEFISLVIKVDGLVSGTNSFSDVDPSVWYAEYIISAAAKNIVNGYADGTFRPTQSVTRAEVVKIINVVLARAAEKGEMKFTDVDSTHWAYDEIVAASK